MTRTCKSFLQVALLTLALGGCAQQLAEAPAVDPIKVCQSYASGVAGITVLMQHGVIDPQGAVADRVADVITVVAPICEADTEPATNSAALQRLLNGVADLITIQTEVLQTSATGGE